MLRLGLLIFAVTLGMSREAQAQARTWAFSKDTVYEWAAGGDSILISNTGIDTLSFDSLNLEPILPAGVHCEVVFLVPSLGSERYHFRYSQGVTTRRSSSITTIKVAAGSSEKLSGFKVESQVPIPAKRAAIGDSMAVRMIFVAAAGQGRDTVVIRGVQEDPTALRAAISGFKKNDVGSRLFDARGRRVENMLENVRPASVPLVSPRK